MKYVAILGTNAKFSYNRKLLYYMKKHFASQAEIIIFEIKDIPFFCEDATEVPDEVNELIGAILKSDGVIFATPEYNHVITSTLKSVLEWLSWEKTTVLQGKAVMIVGASLGNLGTSGAQACLRTILNSPKLESHVLAGNQFLLNHAPEAFDAQGDLNNAKTEGFLENCFDNFVDFSKKFKFEDNAKDSTIKLDQAFKKILDIFKEK